MKTYLTETDDLFVVTTRGGIEVFAQYDVSEDETRFQLTTVADSVSVLDADGELSNQLREALEQQYGVDNVDDYVVAGAAVSGNVLTEEESDALEMASDFMF